MVLHGGFRAVPASSPPGRSMPGFAATSPISPMTSVRHLHTGALFLVMSNGLTATVDAAAKYMSPSLHGVQVVWGLSLIHI